MAKREEEKILIESLIKNNKIIFGELETISKSQRSILLRWLSKGRTNKNGISKTEYGKVYKVEKLGKGDFARVLSIYFKDNLVTHKKEREERERKKEEFFKELVLINKGTRAELWLKEILENKNFGYSIINKNYEAYYKENKIDKFKVLLDYILKGFNSLTFNTNDSENLPMFSSKITKDPHYFDVDKPAGKILIHGICFELKREYPRDVEETAELLYSAGILKDDVSSSIATYGLKAYKKNYELDFIYRFTEFGEPLIFTLGNLSKIDKFLCNKNRLFIFENPSLFSEVIKRTGRLNPYSK
ncbi:Protein of unknown function [Clostridium cochlearium]|uniref:Conserved hypothetical protein CHP02679 N terminus domain-containing protein n=2 Tax=Clostridium cochlearium TaxID=1494 RepID=A0ABY0QMD1_CLOCO|nr:DUF2397 family protein [Bacteroidales bacterium MSK.15.36]SDL25264.1 Protein of unknown function [Clostridium cochlearium]